MLSDSLIFPKLEINKVIRFDSRQVIDLTWYYLLEVPILDYQDLLIQIVLHKMDYQEARLVSRKCE